MIGFFTRDDSERDGMTACPKNAKLALILTSTYNWVCHDREHTAAYATAVTTAKRKKHF